MFPKAALWLHGHSYTRNFFSAELEVLAIGYWQVVMNDYVVAQSMYIHEMYIFGIFSLPDI